jgi:putative ABC transport system permease protein
MMQRYFFRPLALGIKSYRLHQLRSLLTVLGVVFGVASVIVMLAVGEGARSEAVQAIEQLGATNIIVRSVKPSRLAENRETLGALRYGLGLDDLRRMRTTLPRSHIMAPTRDHQREIWHLERRLAGRIVGVTPDYQAVHDIQVADGRFIEPVDVDANRPVAVLGAQAARLLFPLSTPIGESVRIGDDRYFHVVGVLAPRAVSPGVGGDKPPEDFGRDIYIPLTTDLKYFGENVVFDRGGAGVPEKVDISQLIISVPDTGHVAPTARVVQTLIQNSRKTDEAVLTIPLDLLEQAEQTQRVFTLVLGAIASISLLVGGIGIMNIMLATVTERTREIGIRRALGANQLDIITQFLVETAVLSSIGGAVGVALGVAGSALTSRLVDINAVVRFWSPCLALGISVFVGLVFGLYPAYRAARMHPVEALRHE